jgi:hypothetical protein
MIRFGRSGMRVDPRKCLFPAEQCQNIENPG